MSILIKVDFPLPDRPMMLTNSPFAILRLMFFSTCAVLPAVLKYFSRPFTSMIGRPFSQWKSGWLFILGLAFQLTIFQPQNPVYTRCQSDIMRDHDDRFSLTNQLAKNSKNHLGGNRI